MKNYISFILILFFVTVSNIVLASPLAPITNCPIDSAVYNTDQKILRLSAVNVDESITYNAALNLLNTQNKFHFELSRLTQLSDRLATANYQTINQLLTIKSLCLFPDNNGIPGFQVTMQAIPYSQPIQFLLKTANDSDNKIIFNWSLARNQGALILPDRKAFEKLATTNAQSGINGVREIKFVILDLDSPSPILYFIDSNATPLHYDFVRNVLKRYQDLSHSDGRAKFSAESYFRDDRRHLAGSVVAYDNFVNPENSLEKGLYALEFWPTDPVPARLIEKTYRSISAAMPFVKIPLVYHPVGNSHELEIDAFAEQFADKNIPIIFTDTLFEQLDKAVLNKGEAYGRLKVISPGDSNSSEDIIAIYTFIPNILGPVGGIITEQPQTPLSHINLKARQNDTPNAYMKNVRTDPEIAMLIDHWVHYSVTDDGIHIKSATEEESLQWLADKIPTEITYPESDLTLTTPKLLTELNHFDWVRVGVKAANVAELGKILADGIAPKGYALPFAMYDTFMRLQRCRNDMTKLCNNTDSLSLNDYIKQFLENQTFTKNQRVRIQKLEQLRDIIERAEAPQSLIDQVETIRLFWEPEGEPYKQKLRVRSSTNNEDLEGFNGAGLYNSFTHKPKEGQLINTVKQVWASLWSHRAFEERRLHRIDHLTTYMGVLIHTNYGNEQANGVAITKNIFNPDWEGYYINAQYGELSITNPEPLDTENGMLNPIPDEFIITHIPGSATDLIWETLFLRHSNIETVYDVPVDTKNVLMPSESNGLRDNLQIIQKHFKRLYQGSEGFAMDVEFKITETADGSRGNLAIKQARPWVD